MSENCNHEKITNKVTKEWLKIPVNFTKPNGKIFRGKTFQVFQCKECAELVFKNKQGERLTEALPSSTIQTEHGMFFFNGGSSHNTLEASKNLVMKRL